MSKIEQLEIILFWMVIVVIGVGYFVGIHHWIKAQLSAMKGRRQPPPPPPPVKADKGDAKDA